MASNPRLYRKEARLQVIRHGLFRYTKQNCQIPVANNNEDDKNNERFCLWNRNLTACPNMLYIARSLCENDQIPKRF
ncbi:hypothetical protein G6F57_000377 [Rhizopus arrhizus]|uniref:Uncharacterized protein n=1 Tax=Rhizopus oryzae TaxID=64495 RepID=A0A9P7BV65_RHIOR|nr:hypothetical protein G6F23_006300 [Rhizopus arrhizus]KAG1428673.1 hypothetical protein G6F58_000467 [Rhizopus delemar]KAG0769078.1 hypothetical protein G6F24_001390 [Rhizopus arrhizus]KAG0795165.1 hypothetical protein G6F21_002323 [Rhizopus arrhizus]KAG0800442.1 hypothetical protein G6F22_002227 [Rhizopus arrhizus]